MSAALSARYLGEKEFDAWHRLLAASSQGSIYSAPDYLDILCTAAGGRFRILGIDRNGELVGGVALYEQPSGRSAHVGPRLLLYYHSLVLRDVQNKYPSQRTARVVDVLGAIEAALAKCRYGRIILKNHSTITDVRVFHDRGWSVAPSYTYVVPLNDLPAQWDRVEQNLRRFVNRCSELGVTVSDDDDFDSFLALHEQTAERKGAPRYLAPSAFKQYFERLRALGLCRLYHGRLPDGRSISSQLVLLGPYPLSHTVSAAADAAFLRLGATAFLRWRVFERLAGLGYVGNDLTDAALNSVTHFKSQLGGDLRMCVVLSRTESLAFRLDRLLQHVKDIGRTSARAAAHRLGIRHA